MKPINLAKIWGAFCLMSVGLLTQGCVADDLSVCGISMHFRYTRNMDGIDKFSSSVNKINLYVFDKDGLFVEEYVEERDSLPQDFTIFLNLTPGMYDFIAWGNLGEDYEYPSILEKGVTRMSDIQLSLKRNAQNAVTTLPGSLFYGSIFRKEIQATDLQFSETLLMDMMKNTKEIKVIASGLALEDPTKAAELEYGCAITSRNGDYRFDNSITGDTRLQYIPQETVGDEHQLVSDFVILRELSDKSTASKLIVNRNAPDDSVEELVNVDLVPLLVALAQEQDLDVVDHFEIELIFDFTHASVSIVIPGWDGEINTGSLGVVGGKW
ncbi:MAG: FimB/Mfa2 family fimbrial subunit [Tannerellaceae bacterium]|jgi:hypothetical protein|nr:FimB/Mfa2 family fimbrial subunit [Tannerellaceae bacterium]